MNVPPAAKNFLANCTQQGDLCALINSLSCRTCTDGSPVRLR
ncbi:hypothetical protein V3W47_00355 [Deinococcus sp. YIM 134068]